MATHLISSRTKFLGFLLLIFLLSLPHRSYGDGKSNEEYTLAMIKPDGIVGNYTNVIKKIILGAGFSILKEMTLQLDEDKAKGFYAEHSSRSFFPSLVQYMTSGPVLIMVLEKVDAVSDWRALIGPTDPSTAKVTHPDSIRAMCGNKFQGGKGKGESNAVSSGRHTIPEPKKEEFNDWPHELLTIGTFGDRKLMQNAESEILQDDNEPLDHDLAEFTTEEVGKLEKELTKLLSKKPAPKVEGDANLPLDRFLNCPSSLEVDRRISTSLCSESNDRDEEDDINRTIRLIVGRCRDACMETKKKSIGMKSVSFLLKKMFVCRGGFAPPSSLRDSLQESRMEKLLRTMLTKQLYRQNSSRTSSMKKYIEDRQTSKVEKRDETEDTSNVQGNKWVKTDSEYIVLEI